MALRIVRAKTLPIGVDLGSSMLKMVQLRMNEGTPELLAAGSADIPPADRSDDSRKRLDVIARNIRSLLKSADFKGPRCVLSIPAGETFVQHLKVPKLPPQDMALAIRNELYGKLPYPVDEAVIRHIVAGDVYGEGESLQEVIAVCASRRQLEGYLDMARRSKLDVTCVNIEPCAIVECFSRMFRRASDAGRTILLLDLGFRSTQVVLSHGSRIVFARNLKIGGEQFDQAVADGMEVAVERGRALRLTIQMETEHADADKVYALMNTPMKSLCDELTQCLRYYESVFRNQSVEHAIFVGGQAFDKRLCQSIAQRLNLPAQVGDPLAGIKRAEGAQDSKLLDHRCTQPHWAVAIGLSLGASIAA